MRLLTVVVATLVSISACSDDGTADGSGSSTSVELTTTSTSVDASATSSSTTATTTTTSNTPTTLAGEPWDGFVDDGDVLGVMGVAHDDTLNIRATPGTDGAIVTTVEPTADDLVATGRARMLPSSFWYEVTVNGETGWASISFLAFLGGTDDATAEFLDGRAPIRADTMVQLGSTVAAGFASEDPRSNIVQSVAEEVGDLAEITYDVVGIGDDAQAGYRLHIFATPTGNGFVLKSIERTAFCTRGLAGELCT